MPDTVTTFKIVASEQTHFRSDLEFANRISSKYKTATITHTGPSLGGCQWQYVGAEREEKAVSFAAPNVYGLLSDEAKKRVNSGETREYIRDYVYCNDLISMFTGGDPLIGKEYIVANNVEHISLHDNPIAEKRLPRSDLADDRRSLFFSENLLLENILCLLDYPK